MTGSVSAAFANAYLTCGVLASLAVLMRLNSRLSDGVRLLSLALAAPLVLLYLNGMYRIAGIDYDTYQDAYTDQGQPIPDVGYTALTWLTRSFGVGFSTFLLLQGIFTLVALWVASRARQADPLVVIVVYLLHLAVVRDMSQSRIGLAVAVYLLGQTRERSWIKALLYVAAASVHITVVVLMFVWFVGRMTDRMRFLAQVLVVYVPLVAFAIFGVVLLNNTAWVDPRIELYLSWNEAAYGAPLESFGALLRGLAVVCVYLLASRRLPGLRLRNYVVMELCGAAILIGFSQFSIFAARLANVAVSMYPIGLGIVALALQSQRHRRMTSNYGFPLKIATAAAIAILLVRPGTLDILQEVLPKAFVELAG
jgi:hypothetical protein